MPDHRKKTKILILEDEVLFALDLEVRLKGFGYEVCGGTADADKIFLIIDREQPELVLMDIVLKGEMDGIEIARVIREKWDIPVVFLTGYADTERLERAKLTYPFGYIIKPCRDRDLKITLEMALYVSEVDKKRKKVEEKLRERERILREAQEIAHLGSWELALESGKIIWSDEIFRIYGLDPTDDGVIHYQDVLQQVHPDDLSLHNNALKDILNLKSDKDFVEFEERIIRPDGTERWIYIKGEVRKGKDGLPMKLFGVTHDITERKYTEGVRRETEKRLKFAQRIAELGDFSWDVGTGEVTWSDGLYDLLRYDKSDEIDFKNVNKKIHHPDDLERVTEWLNDCISSGNEELTPNEYRVIRKDGKTIYVRTVGVIERIEGRPPKVFATVQDVTHRRKSEEDLKENQRILDATGTIGKIGGWEHDFTTGKAFWTRALFDVIEIPFDKEPPGENEHLSYYPPKDRKILEQAYHLAVTDGTPFDLELQAFTAKKRPIWCRAQGEPVYKDGKCVGMRGTFQDITKRKQAEIALLEREFFLNTLLQAIPVPVFYKDMDGRYLGLNRAFEKLIGVTREQLIGKTVFDVYPTELAKMYYEKDNELLEAGGVQEYEFKIKNDRGVLRNVLFNKAVFRDSQGNVSGLIGTILDITERKRAEGELRERRAELEQIIEALPDALVFADVEGRITKVNNAFCRTFGYNPIEILGKTTAVLQAETDDSNVREQRRRAIGANGITIPHKTQYCRKNGELFPCEIVGTSVKDTHDRTIGYLELIRDISESKRAEEEKEKLQAQLRQAQKLEAIGSLAGGVAHDFNNILSAIVGYTQIALFDVPESNPAHENLKSVMKASDRAKDLVRQILTFSRQVEIQFIPLSMAPIVNECIKFLRSSLPSTIEIRHDIQDTDDKILGDPTQIYQVIMNLCTNAAQVLGESGGLLEIKLNQIYLEYNLYSDELKPGYYMQLIVSDTGHGMDRETMEKIFDPYFTTKATDRNIGLGLSVVHGIVKEHGGEIKVYSEVGLGTSIKVIFPVVSETPFSEGDQETDIVTGHERILFIDDEVALVDLGKRMLERLGYSVDAYTDSTKALEVFRSSANEYDLIITDQTMPELTGTQLAREVLRIRPEIPIILCTGFSYSVSAQKAKEVGIKGFLMKPIIMSELASTIRTALDEKE